MFSRSGINALLLELTAVNNELSKWRKNIVSDMAPVNDTFYRIIVDHTKRLLIRDAMLWGG